MESSKTSSEMDSIFDTEGEVNLEDQSQLTEEADYESDWSEANAILHQDSDDCQDISDLIRIQSQPPITNDQMIKSDKKTAKWLLDKFGTIAVVIFHRSR